MKDDVSAANKLRDEIQFKYHQEVIAHGSDLAHVSEIRENYEVAQSRIAALEAFFPSYMLF